MLKIYVVTDDFKSSVVELFSKVGVVQSLPKNYRTIEDFSADVIVFTGGEDINPEKYGGRSPGGFYNNRRDNWELKVLDDIMDNKLKTKKVLGICRGMQLINVGLGGTLHYDIPTVFGKGHDGYHKLLHRITSKLSFLSMTNSMHHQALDLIGSLRNDKYYMIATEPETGVYEIVLWGNTMLGVQFHPEFFPDDNEAKWQFAEVVRDWCDGASIVEAPPARPASKNREEFTTEKLFRYIEATPDTWSGTGRISSTTSSD